MSGHYGCNWNGQHEKCEGCPDLSCRLRDTMWFDNNKAGRTTLYRNSEGSQDSTAGRAIRKADKPPENVINFRRAMKLMCTICHVRVLGKITVVDERGRRW